MIGDSAAIGVVDAWHPVFDHPGLDIVYGAAISPNLGVNPSLTITAQADCAMAFWPNKGAADPARPWAAPTRRSGRSPRRRRWCLPARPPSFACHPRRAALTARDGR